MERTPLSIEIHVTRKSLVLAVGLLLLTAALVIAGSAVAQAPELSALPASGNGARDEVHPLTATDTVSASISYQGVLREDGSLVNGTRTITFTLYSDASCTQDVHSVVHSDVSVSDGLFKVLIDVNPADFDGQALWLGAQMKGTAIGCQPIMAAPYALSLRPGARVVADDAATSLYLQNDGSGAALHAVHSSDGIAVQGASISGRGVSGVGISGPGVYGKSTSGPAVYADGPVETTAETVITANPLNAAIHVSSAGDLTLRPTTYYLEVHPEVNGNQYVLVPVDVPTTLLGTATRLKSARICYKCDTQFSPIEHTGVSYIGDSDVDRITLISDLDSHGSTSWQCYTLEDSKPDTIGGPLVVEFTMDFLAANENNDIQLGKITLTLVE